MALLAVIKYRTERRPVGPVKNSQPAKDLFSDPKASAQAVGLDYTQDTDPGIRRIRCGRGFRYLGPDGVPLRGPETLQRIRALVIPPAWTDVWICAAPRGHLQATGRDARGRKQYLYHPDWVRIRGEAKFEHVLQFAATLPSLRRRVEADLSRRGLPREKVEAAVIRLLEESLFRIGNEEYLRENRSFGLTTLRRQHVAIESGEIRFAFRGKSGQWQERSVRDRRVARILRSMLDLPGQELFRCFDADGQLRAIASDDINSYLRETTGFAFTAKDIRTWHATVAAAGELQKIGSISSARTAKVQIAEAVRRVAKLLGNRPGACRKYYIHPLILESYRAGILLPALSTITSELHRSFLPELSSLENAVRRFLAYPKNDRGKTFDNSAAKN